MRMFWKRHMISNIIGLLFVCVLVGVYISLLRFNKASASNFNLVPKSIRAHPSRNRYGNHKLFGGVFHFGNTGKSFKTNVHVVEEHHEVLPIWFEAMRNGYIPEHGNTLIHIDGHSDMAPPYFLSRYPAWRPPKDSKEMHTMMQRNDAFIVEAAMAGLIRKVIWIWPKWTEKEHEEPEQTVQVEVGWAQIEGSHHMKYKVFCLCHFDKPNNDRICIYLPLHRTTSDTGIPIKPHLCHVKKSFLYKEIREDLATSKLLSNKLVLSGETVLLDIDEDYYGCTYASKPLLDANMTMDSIHKLDSLIQKLFCPQDAFQEQESDKILVSVLAILRKVASCHGHNMSSDLSNHLHGNKKGKLAVVSSNNEKSKLESQHGLSVKKSHELEKSPVYKFYQTKNATNPGPTVCKEDPFLLLKEAESMIKKYLWHLKHSVACGKKTQQGERLVKDLIYFLKQLSPRQLRSLQYVGFCLSSSPKSTKLVARLKFHVCHGLNYPGNSAVDVHLPNVSEVQKRSRLLRDILFAMQSRKPAMTTVCRSVRDGYTPRRYFNRIESDIIKALNTTFKNVNLHYDFDLLGGKKGWPSRHKVSPK